MQRSQHPPRHPSARLFVAAAPAAAVVLALLAFRPPIDGATWGRGDDLALVVAWIVAITASTWLFLATAACAIAVRSGRAGVARRIMPTLPRGLRHLVEVAIVASCVALPTAAAGASPAPTTPVVADQPVVRAPASAAPVSPAPVSPVPNSAPAPVAPAPLQTATSAIDHVVVRSGDNLWLIARAAVTRAGTDQPADGQPSDRQVARYWRAVIAANRSTLRSGNPSLIFPGEIVALPAISGLP